MNAPGELPFASDGREVGVDDAMRVIEHELRQHLDAHQRIAIERALWALADLVAAQCRCGMPW